ncbi:hypothetical protein L3X38_013451 [Prunus dulcis]|uniref:Uncharacterized protein n=1 Tax=Prunus dulcis TaxID=3755 RepID=A0AAD4WMX3_PRUDU|nr:hypothetical protein L3X38_013451 [Prunus dulcis]
MYPTYTCSRPLYGSTKAYLTLNSFEAGGDGGGPSECDKKYHNDNTPVVALSTGWYNNGGRPRLPTSLLQRLSGKPWVCLRTTGGDLDITWSDA